MDKPIVVFVGGFRLPQGNASAVRCYGNTSLMKRLGYTPVIVGKIDPQSKKAGQQWYNFFGVECLDIEQCGGSFTSGIEYVKAVTERFGVQRIKAFIAYNYPGKALNMLRKWCVRNGISIISDTTEWYALEGKNPLSAILRKLSTEYRMRFVNKRIGNIICSTNYIRDYYKKCKNTIVIPNIIFDEKGSNRELKVNEPYRFIYAGSPGNKFSKDDIETIVKIFLAIDEKKYRLAFYGFTKKVFLQRYPEYESALCKNESITFMGRVQKAVIDEALKEADFYVLYRPNTKVNKVGFSTKAMEAISAGVPLIANDVNGDFAVYFRNNQALISEADNPEAFAQNVQKAINMPVQEALDMQKNCLEHNPFTAEKYEDAMMAFMNNLA